MKCEPIAALGRATAIRRAGLRARITFRFAVVARRTREMARLAALALAIALARAGLARRTVFRTGRLPCIEACFRTACFRTERVRDVRRFAAVVLRAGLRRIVFARRTVARRAGLARRTVFLAVAFPLTTRRFREGLFFAVRDRDVRDLLNITTYPPQLKVRRPWLHWVNTV